MQPFFLMLENRGPRLSSDLCQHMLRICPTMNMRSWTTFAYLTNDFIVLAEEPLSLHSFCTQVDRLCITGSLSPRNTDPFITQPLGGSMATLQGLSISADEATKPFATTSREPLDQPQTALEAFDIFSKTAVR